mmetsp:Transcript_35362/g.82668  ORF Transcript_35362/g.82668 Transcript_35362/m.82668 type:complete len:390 (-) Transcript_35362:150-1319(-)
MEAAPPRLQWGWMHATNLAAFRPAGAPLAIDIPPHSFSEANRIAKCAYGGSVFKGEHKGHVVAAKVVSKRVVHSLKFAETNDLRGWWRGSNEFLEDPLTEIGILQELARQPQDEQCEFLPRIHGIYQTRSDVVIMTEFALGGALQPLVEHHGPLPEHQVKKYMQQLCTAIEYLNKLNIAHRDISLENLLVHNDNLRLMDFGAACQIANGPVTLRYFRYVGKPYYIAPEMYIPRALEVTVVFTPSRARPGEVHFAQTSCGHLIDVKLPQAFRKGVRCEAQPWGYATQKVDSFAAGVCFYIMSFGIVPWPEATLKDGLFHYYYKNGSRGLLKLVERMRRVRDLPTLSVRAMEFMNWTLQPDPYDRPDAETCLDHGWFHCGGIDDDGGFFET